MKTYECYQCGEMVAELSPRSRCVMCEYNRAEFNEKENDTLRDKLANSHLVRRPWELREGEC
jgi:hypothetical protein